MKIPKLLQDSNNRHTLRAAILIALSTLIYVLTGFKHGYWMTLTVIILIQSNVGATIKKSWERILGTISGVMLGVILSMLLSKSLIAILIIAILLIFFGMYAFILSYSWSLFAFSIMIVMVLSITSLGAVDAAFYRLVDTMLGALIVILGSLLLWPDHAATLMRVNYRQSLKDSSNLLAEMLTTPFDKTAIQNKLFALQQQLEKARNSLSAFNYEMSTLLLAQNSILAAFISAEHLLGHLSNLANLLGQQQNFHVILEAEELKNFCECILQQTTILVTTTDGKMLEVDFENANKALNALKTKFQTAAQQDTTVYLLLHYLNSYLHELIHIYYSASQTRRYLDSQLSQS